ncbi:MAG TPA: DUF4258 domain-containing protein [Tepidisphaeraceae bacterium]|nr:DUF4258 domain-containing protein [Tepidisphaeraceae bacterium]
MGVLAENIRQAVRNERYVFGAHADERLRERRIAGWQILGGLDTAKILRERSDARPNPVAEFEQPLADGTSVKSVWAWISIERTAKLVTVHFFDR